MQSKSNKVPVIFALAMSGIAAGFSGTVVACHNAEPTVEREPPRAAAPAIADTRPVNPPAAGTVAPPSEVKALAPGAERAGSLPAVAERPAEGGSREPADKGALPERPVGSTAADLEVGRLVITSGVEAREPVASPDLKAGGEPIYAFVELKNASDDAGSIVITFEQGEKSVGHIALAVPAKAKRFRTWGRTAQIKTGGEWQAVVRNEAGKELGRTTFSVGS